jgi:hypothetical protein
MFTDCLQIFFAALESPLEGPAFVHARVAIAQLAMALFVASISVLVHHRGLESTTKITLIVLEFTTVGFILLFFGIAQTHPPHFARTIDTFSAGMFQRATNCVSFVIIRHHHHDGSAFAQRVLVNVQFVLRKSFEYVALQLASHGPAADCTKSSKYHAASDSNCKDRAHARNQKTRYHRNQADASGNAHGTADDRAYGFTHARLLSCNCWHGRDLLIARMRRENRDSVSWNIQGHQLRCANLCIRSRLENSYNGFHGASLFSPLI